MTYYFAKPEPREPIPQTGVAVFKMVTKPIAESVPPDDSDVVDAILPIQDVDPALLSEIGDPHFPARAATAQ